MPEFPDCRTGLSPPRGRSFQPRLRLFFIAFFHRKQHLVLSVLWALSRVAPYSGTPLPFDRGYVTTSRDRPPVSGTSLQPGFILGDVVHFHHRPGGKAGLVLRSFQLPPSPPRSGLRFTLSGRGQSPHPADARYRQADLPGEDRADILFGDVRIEMRIANACFQVSHGQV